MHSLINAIEIAVRTHGATLDKSGQPWMLHPPRVMMAQRANEARIAGVLHDVVEDTDVTHDDLKAAGLPDASLQAGVRNQQCGRR